MSDVFAQCAQGHRWPAIKIAKFEHDRVVRIVDPPKCPKCKKEWIVVTEKNEVNK